MAFSKIKVSLIVITLIAVFLRLWNISKVPVSLFGDELDVGYHAYSVLKTGRDYYGNFLPIHFHSIAEWRTPLYLYSAVPSVFLFGITPLGVRFPAALFGIMTIPLIYLLANKLFGKDQKHRIVNVGLIAAFVLTFSPWHIQYSRAGFEVTQLLFLLLLGIYLFLLALKKPKLLWLSVASFCLTPWVYSTAKFFTPLIMLVILLIYRKDILSLPKKYLVYAIVAGIIFGGPIAYGTLFGGGTQRFDYISVFSDPTLEPQIGTDRQLDAAVRGEIYTGLKPSVIDMFYHNKFVVWTRNIGSNYFSALSANFLFVQGDPNPRHSINGMGEFYPVDSVILLAGLVFFFAKYKERKEKLLLTAWLLLAPLPASITRDGGNHATRLILILPPLVMLIAYGFTNILDLIKRVGIKRLFIIAYLGLFAICFVFYQHNYWIHNPWYSERWWHAGFKESFDEIKKVQNNYDKVIISMSGEPAWVFFAAYMQYPPDQWQKNFPIGNDASLVGFGKMSHIDKYYFGSPSIEGGIYSLSKYIDNNTLYLAVAKEVGANLIMQPDQTPVGLKLIKAIPYPSGEPAYYLFTKS